MRSESDLEYIIYEAIKKYSERTLEEIASFFMHGIATKHPYFDGNKRTALMTFLVFRFCELKPLEILEKIIKHTPNSWENKDDNVVKFMLELAGYKHSYKYVLKFVNETFK